MKSNSLFPWDKHDDDGEFRLSYFLSQVYWNDGRGKVATL